MVPAKPTAEKLSHKMQLSLLDRSESMDRPISRNRYDRLRVRIRTLVQPDLGAEATRFELVFRAPGTRSATIQHAATARIGSGPDCEVRYIHRRATWDSDSTCRGSEAMSAADEQLKVISLGPRTVLGFGGQEILTQLNVAVYRDHLLGLIEEHDIKTVAFDLNGIVLVPSGLLGVLASLRQHDVRVEVFNPSRDVRDVLSITRLDELFQILDGDPLGDPDVLADDA